MKKGNILPGWGAILWHRWEKHCSSKDVIVGCWYEDGNHYNIMVPTQLRDIIIQIQNWLSDIYVELEAAKSKCNRINNFFNTKY